MTRSGTRMQVLNTALEKPSARTFVGELLVLLLDLAGVVSYFLGVDNMLCGVPNKITFTHFPIWRELIIFNGALGCYYATLFLFQVLLRVNNRVELLLSWQAFVTVVTSIPSIVALVLLLVTNSTQGVTLWAPLFVRVWYASFWIDDMLCKYATMGVAIRKLVVTALSLSAHGIVVMGLFQFLDALYAGCPITTVETLYYLFATASTVGFGDIVPTTYQGRVTAMCFIFCAMFKFPQLVQDTSDVRRYLLSQNSYTDSARHVIVCGKFGTANVKVMLRALKVAERRLRVVVVTEEPLSRDVQAELNAVQLRGLITVCQSNVSGPGEVHRFGVRRALAVFLLSPDDCAGMRGDYQTIVKVTAFRQYAFGVVQCAMFKRMPASITQPLLAQAGCAVGAAPLQRERLKYAMMSAAMQLPCFIPFFFNLLSHQPAPLPRQPKTRFFGRHRSNNKNDSGNNNSGEEPCDGNNLGGSVWSGGGLEVASSSSGWWDEYLDGRSNALRVVCVPELLVGRMYSIAAQILYLRYNVILVGVAHRDQRLGTQHVAIADMQRKLRESDELLVISRHRHITEDSQLSKEGNVAPTASLTPLPDAKVMQSLNSLAATAGHEPFGLHGGGMQYQSHRRNSKQQQQQHQGPLHHHHHHTHSIEYGEKSALSFGKHVRSRRNVFPFSNHIVLIDVSATDALPSMTQEELIDQGAFQVEDLQRLLEPYMAHPTTSIVLLSQSGLSEAFCNSWPETMRPIYHVSGSSLDPSNIALCEVARASRVVIFSSVNVSPPNINVLATLQTVHAHLAAAGCETSVPVICEMLDVSATHLAEPNVCATVQHDVLREIAHDFGLAPAFVIGRMIATTMLDAVLFCSFDNGYLPAFVEELLHQRSPGVLFCRPVASLLPVVGQSCTVSQFCFADLVRCAVATHCMPLGVSRVILDDSRGKELRGHRFFYTNPPPSTRLCESDEVYFLHSTSGAPAPADHRDAASHGNA